MPKRNHPSDGSSNPFGNRGFRAANPELFKSPPGTQWDTKGLLNKRSDLNDPKRFIYEFPIPARLISHCKQQIPIISFGDNAPVPRWRLASDPTDPAFGRDLEKDLVRTVGGKTIIHGVAPDSHPKSFDSSIGLGGLQWVFDPGLLVNHHNQLHGEPLYEMAYYCLIEALRNQISRTQMRREIANGPFWPEVCNVEDPLPPPPERPKTHFWTKHLDISNEAETRSDNKTYMRPRIDARSKRSIPIQASTPAYSDRLWYHEKGTQGPLHQADPQGTSSINHEEVSNNSDYEKDKTARTGTPPNPEVEAAMPIDVQLAIEAVSKLERKVAKLRQNSTWSGVKRRRREIGKQTSQNKAYPNDRRKRHITKKVTFDMSDDQAVHVDIEDPIIRTSKMEMSKKNEPTPAQVSVESSESEESDSVPEANVLKRFPTLAPGEVNMTIGDNSDYLQTFKEACKHSKDRKKYFPLPRAVRRIKPWAGAKLPPAVERKVRAYLPEEPTAHRPFSSRKKADDNDAKASPAMSKTQST